MDLSKSVRYRNSWQFINKIVQNINTHSFQIILIFTIFLDFSLGFERDLTINVDPGKSDCFYQQATKGQVIDVEFQVIKS